jgi:hypothetical protein
MKLKKPLKGRTQQQAVIVVPRLHVFVPEGGILAPRLAIGLIERSFWRKVW